mmetsp:Transcript_8385/g.16642  ORF Transcript_8385/g.16642 Transcript_8385/m.16642 type:complete len:2837 (+) Transcript_8385:32-8542(+)
MASSDYINMQSGSASDASLTDLTQWVTHISSLSSPALLEALHNLRTWEWPTLDDLSPVMPLMLKLHSTLTETLDNYDAAATSQILSSTKLILANTTSKVLYDSVSVLARILDHSDLLIVFQALEVLHLLVSRSSPVYKATKAHRDSSLATKLYVISQGTNLNSVESVSLKDICMASDPPALTFQYKRKDSLCTTEEAVPDVLSYVLLNRRRNRDHMSSQESRELVVAAQLLATSVFLQCNSDNTLLQDFLRSMPEVWLLPSLAELIRLPLSPLVHTEIVHLLAALLVFSDPQHARDSSYSSLIQAADGLLASKQQHGLLQSLLRDIVMPVPSFVVPQTAKCPEFVAATIHLASIVADYKYRIDTSHVPSMTASLLQILKCPENDTYQYKIYAMTRAARVLAVLVSHAIEMFKEMDGIGIVLKLANYELKLLGSPHEVFYASNIEGKPTRNDHKALVRAVLRLLKVALSKWEQLPGIASGEVRRIIESEIIEHMRGIFLVQCFEIYEPCLQLLCAIVNEQPGVISELNSRNCIQPLLESLENGIPSQPKLISSIARMLCVTSLHSEGARQLEAYDTIPRLLQALGRTEGGALTNELSVDIAESIHDVLSRVSKLRDKAVEGCVQMLQSIQTSEHRTREVYFNQLTNIGRLLSIMFNSATEMIRGFIEKGGLDAFLAIFKDPVRPLTHSNEYHFMINSFKAFPGTQSSGVINKVLGCLEQKLNQFEGIVGGLTVPDFSHIPAERLDELILCLTSTDSFVEMIGLILKFGYASIINADLLEKEIGRLSQYMRILIAEQARLSTFSKDTEKTVDHFNVHADFRDIENPELNSFEENFYFTCQLSVRKLLRQVTRYGTGQRRQAPSEDNIMALSKSISSSLAALASELTLPEPRTDRAYYLSLLLADIVKILLHEQSSCLYVYAFVSAGGTQHFANFLQQLMAVSHELSQRTPPLSFNLVNAIQILWSLSGKMLECMAACKYTVTPNSNSCFRAYGASDHKDAVRKIKSFVLTTVENLNFFECGRLSSVFMKSVLDVLLGMAELVKEPTGVDSSAVRALTDMGFSQSQAQFAIMQVGASSVEMAMEWLLSHPDVPNIQASVDDVLVSKVSAMFSELHIRLIPRLRVPPQLQTQVAELLLKISAKSETMKQEIGQMLTNQAASQINSLMPGSSLESFAPTIEADFELLTSTLQVLATLVAKSATVLTEVQNGRLSEDLLRAVHAILVSPDRFQDLSWLPSAFAIWENLVKFKNEPSEEIARAIAELVGLASSTSVTLWEDTSLNSLLQLLVALTAKTSVAKILVQKNLLKSLLTLKMPRSDVQSRGLINNYSALLKQLAESPAVLQANFEVSLKQAISDGPHKLDNFLRGVKNYILRDGTAFDNAFSNTCTVVRRDRDIFVEDRKERGNQESEAWSIVEPIAEALIEVFDAEQAGQSTYVLQTDNIVSLLADVVQAAPPSIENLLHLQVHSTETRANKLFLTTLVRQVIPFRYTLKLTENKVTYTYPTTENPVTPQNYQSWVKISLKLLRSLCFKQAYKNPGTPVAQLHNHVVLNSNGPALKARKKVFREFRDMLTDATKKGWFGNEKSMASVRAAAITFMQMLRETAKNPFTSNNPAELAKMLISEPFNLIKVLCEAARGVNLNFKKANSILNILLAPIELLTHYSISFALHSAKHHSESEDMIVEDDLQDEGMGKYEVSDHSAPDDEEEQSEEVFSVDSDDEMGEEDEGDEPDEMDDIEDMEDVEDMDHVSVDEEDEPIEEIMLEGRNTEDFWAEDLEEDNIPENSPAREWLRGRHSIESMLQQERALIEPPHLMHQDMDELPNLGSYMQVRSRRHMFEFEEPRDMMHLIRELDPSNEEFISILMQRRGLPTREVLADPPRAQVNTDSILETLTYEYASQAVEAQPLEVPQIPVVEPTEPVLIPVPIPEEVKMDIEEPVEPLRRSIDTPPPALDLPEGIDPEVFAELPDEIRNEILAQHRRERPQPPRGLPDNSEISEEFLQALPAELRQEVLDSQRPPARAPQEIDNASFIASLTPDLRREVLLSANEELLNSLPPELVAEARALQERIHRNQQYAYIERQQPQVVRRHQEESKYVAEIAVDDKLSNQLVQVDDSFIELLLKSLYLINPVNSDILTSLFINISANPHNRTRLLESLLTLLRLVQPEKNFPPTQLYGSEHFTENYSHVYAVVAGRILDILLHLTKQNPRVSTHMVSSDKARIPALKHIKPTTNSGLQTLMSLLGESLYRSSSIHVTPLVNLIAQVVTKQEENVPALDAPSIGQICSLLTSENVNETAVKELVEIVKKLSVNGDNRHIIEQVISNELTFLSEELIECLQRFECSKSGLREVELLRLTKVLRIIEGQAPGLSRLWEPLTQALNFITSSESDLASTTNPLLSKLLPVIETFFLYHSELSTEEVYKVFTDKNRKVLNLLVRQNPTLLEDTLNSLITKFPQLLDFENKRTYFKTEMRKLKPERNFESIRLLVRREQVFMDSYNQLRSKSTQEMYGKLRVQYVGEEGIDAGGLTREWFELLSKELFNPNYALFIQSSNGVSFQPNPLSFINTEHLEYFKFVGRVIGKALLDGYLLDVYFTRSFYKHIIGQEVTYTDMEESDPEMYKSLLMLLNLNLDESDLHEYYFYYEEEEFGKIVIKELIPDGRSIRVTEKNKMDYINGLCQMKMSRNIKSQINSFLTGFHELIPKQLVSVFDSKELELLISGLPTIDTDDLRAHTDYHNYTEETPVIKWFWEVMEEFSNEERAEFMQFVTGSSKVPLEGFKALQGMGGVQHFQIHKSFTSAERLPTSHTCMNQLDLPEYPDKQTLYKRLKLAVSEGKEGFGFV